MRSSRSSVIDTYREKGVGEGGQVDARRMTDSGMLVNAVRMKAPVHTLADQCGWMVLGLFVGGEVLACLVCSARARVGERRSGGIVWLDYEKLITNRSR